MTEQTRQNIALATVLLLAYVVFILFLRPVVAQREFGPSYGVCYATNGRTVQVTNLDGGGLFYPGPTDATVVQTEDGFEVTVRTEFRRIGMRVWLPVVSRE